MFAHVARLSDKVFGSNFGIWIIRFIIGWMEDMAKYFKKKPPGTKNKVL
jgi:hypothetical protein